jgi:lactoylglutathione lyase
MKVSYTIVFVSDMRKSIEFYRDVVGMPVRFESPHWTEFETVGATLALHLVEGTGNGGPPVRNEAPGGCRPGFSVPDLQEFHRRVISMGVQCVQEPKDVFGAQVAMYLDPDRLAFSVGEERSASPM